MVLWNLKSVTRLPIIYTMYYDKVSFNAFGDCVVPNLQQTLNIFQW